MLLCPLLVLPSEARQGRVWLALDIFSSHISPQGECWLFPVQLEGTNIPALALGRKGSSYSWEDPCRAGVGSRDLRALSPVQWEHWFMQEPLESALAADTHPLPFPLPHHAMRHCRGKWLLRAVTIFKSPSSSFVTVL